MSTSHELTCPLCHKRSDNKKAHTRHISYCRSKSKRPLRSRKRSCLACIKAKTHCDAATSLRCTRCTQKGIECKFQSISQDGPSPRSSLLDVSDAGSSDALISSQSLPLLDGWKDAANNQTLISLDEQVNQSIDGQLTYLPLSNVSESPATSSALSTTDINRWLIHDHMSNPWSTMNTNYALGPHLSLQPVRAFTPRGATLGPFSLLGKYVAQTMRQYPFMMLSEENPSPFIHYICLTKGRNNTHNNEPGPLLRCIALVELWRGKTQNNASYLWNVLRIEQERLMKEMSEYEDMIAINALQAITIYILLRVSSTEDEGANFDIPLIQTMIQLIGRVGGIITKYNDPASPIRPSICGWVMAESLRRTIAALFIIELLFDISPGIVKARCNSIALWSEMLLPCSQQLWQAKTKSEWTQVYDLLSDNRPYYGELLRHEHLRHDRSALLKQWMANTDDFGKLVINIASVAETAC